MNYKLKITFTEPYLGSSPCDPEVYAKFIATKVKDEKEEAGEEVATLPAESRERSGWTVFHKNAYGLFVYDYRIRGFLKEAATAITSKTEVSAIKSKIDKWLFASPRVIQLCAPGGTFITEPHGVLERPLRAMTMQGPRVSVVRSDLVNAGTYFEAELLTLPLGEKDLNEERLRSWLDYGKFQGLGQWRNGSYGRFTYELAKA